MIHREDVELKVYMKLICFSRKAKPVPMAAAVNMLAPSSYRVLVAEMVAANNWPAEMVAALLVTNTQHSEQTNLVYVR